MAIEITEFADVSIGVSPSGVSSGNFGILGFLTNSGDVADTPISPAERARYYTSIASVGEDWPADTETYKAALSYYGQTPTPRDFVAIMSFTSPQVASVVGGTHDTLEEIKTLTAGSFTITIDTVEAELTNVNFGSAADLDGVATLLEDALNADLGAGSATVTYGAYGFIVNGVVPGLGGNISYGTEYVAKALGLDQANAKAADGIDSETPLDSLTEAVSAGIEFTALVTHKVMRDVIVADPGQDTTLDVAKWCDANKKIFCNTSNSLSVLDATNEQDIASVLKNASIRMTLTTFSKDYEQYPSASVFGRAASVNFASVGSTITLNLKQMPGVTAENLTPNQFSALRGKNASAVVQIGKSNAAYTDSRMAGGSWLDTIHGLLWLENRAEVDMFNLLYQSPTKVPYTQTGINITAATLQRSLEAAVTNGLCAPGYLPDGTYLSEGYKITYVPLAGVTPDQKSDRIYAGLSFVMIGAGAMHEVIVNGSFAE